MGCGNTYDSEHCVCDVLREIAGAQTDVTDNCCDTSCDQSISDLLGDTDKGNNLDTVPVLLYCEDGCTPFKGFGANPNDIGDIVGSYYFRVKRVKDDCCAVLELLKDSYDHGNPEDPVSQYTGHLKATGVCITVDLKCFCHVTCLPAISAFY